MASTEKRIFSGVVVGFISFTLGFIQAILLVPILLSFWGNETYGIWLVLNAGYIILQTLDTGHQQYIGNEFNINFFSARDNLRSVLASSLRIAFIIGILQLLIVLFLFLSNTSHLFLGLDLVTVEKEYLSICLILLVISWISSGTYTSILSKLLIPYGYYSKSVWWNIYNRLGAFIVLVIIAFSRGSILDATIGISIFTVAFNFLFLYRIKVLLPDVYPWWKYGNWKLGFNNLLKSSLLTISGIVSQFSNNGIIILVTYLFNAAVVPVYTTLRTLTNSAVQITNLIIQPLQPDIVKYYSERNTEKLQMTFNANWFFSGVIVNVGLIFIIPFIDNIFRIWTKGMIKFDFILFLSLSASISVINFGAGLYNLLYSINSLREITIISLTRFFTLLVFSFYLTGYFGLAGVGIAVLLSEIICSVLLPHYFTNKILKVFQGKLKAYYLALIAPFILTLYLIIELYGIHFNFLVWGIALSITVLVYIFHWRMLNEEIKIRIKDLFSNLLSNSR
ncbi:MAG: hypothetical protein IPM14_14945 [bacterium]|nr:hypothetical protein [bacterium]